MGKKSKVVSEILPLKKLKPAKYNPRDIDDDALAGLKASVERFGLVEPIVWNKRTGNVVGGHQRLKVLQAQGETEAQVQVVDLSPTEEKALNLTLNNYKIEGHFTDDALGLLDELEMNFKGFEDMGLDTLRDELDRAFPDSEANQGEPGNNGEPEPPPPEVPVVAVSKPGEIWTLGDHRLMCGDSSDRKAVAALIGKKTKALLFHADPPYGMGKEADGVTNDNLYKERLDDFIIGCWSTWRGYLEDNASAYIWGNAESLWRLWFSKLQPSEILTMRNEIVWEKDAAHGVNSDQHRMFPTASERCLFFILGEQGFNNNAENYWDGWTPLVDYLAGEKEKVAWTIKECKRLAGHSEKSGSHWFDKSQWMMPTRETYDAWKEAADGLAFVRTYDDLKMEYEKLKRAFWNTRFFFDNTHEFMTDVWRFPRVSGDDRFGHATPKPVAMIARCIKSSCPEGGLVLEPYGGTGATLIAAETTGRICYTMEIEPRFVDVIIQRWADLTGKEPTRKDGLKWSELNQEENP